MIPVVSLLILVTISLVVTRVAAVALVHTGLDSEAARFQARSAFTGVGFTTSEAESVVDHPVRRRVVMALMLVGNIGVVSVMSSLILSFIDMGSGAAMWPTLALMAGGLGALLFLGSSRWVDQHVCRVISWALNRFTSVEARDYARLLHLREDYGVTELRVAEGDWIAGRALGETGLVREGVLVLGIECPGNRFVGAPAADTRIEVGDRLLLYGRTPRIAEIDARSAGSDGDAAHWGAVSEWESVAREERDHAGR